MSWRWVLLCLCIQGYGEVMALANRDLVEVITNLFSLKRVSQVIAYVCWDKDEHTLFRSLSLAGIKLAVAARNRPEMTSHLLTERYTKLGVVVDSTCEGAQEFLCEASKSRRFSILHHWLVIDSGGALDVTTSCNVTTVGQCQDLEDKRATLERAEGVFNRLNPPPDSKVMWIHTEREGVNDLSLFEVYRPNPQSQLRLDMVGRVDTKTLKVELILKDDFWRTRRNLQGVTLRSATVIEHPYEYGGLETMTRNEVDTWAKIHYPTVALLAQQLNFSVDMVIEGSYGWMQPNGSFDGMMGLLQRREIDMTGTGIFMRTDRMPFVDFAADTFRLRSAIMFRQPTLSAVKNIFTLPFTRMVWLSCAIVAVVTLVVLGVQMKTTSCGSKVDGKPEDQLDWGDAVTFILGILCQQGCHVTPSSTSGRVTLFVFFLTSFFLYTSYSANIVALLQTPSSAISSLETLTESPLELGLQNTTYNKKYVKEVTTHSVKGGLIRRKLSKRGESAYCDPAEGLERIRNGMFAYQVDLSVAYKIVSETYTEREKCGLMEIELFPLPRFAIATVKESPHRELFAQRLRWQREVGILKRLYNTWILQKPVCEGTTMGFVSVGIMDFWPAMAVYLCGVALSVFIFFAELLFFHRMKLVGLFVKAYRAGREKKMKRAFNKVAVPVRAPVTVTKSRRKSIELVWAWMD